MLELVLEGSAFDRGYKHGAYFARQIQPAVLDLWQTSDSRAVVAAIAATADHISQSYPDINEEIRGIAAGAGVSFEQAFLFNNRSLLNAIPSEECSNVAVVRNGSAIMGMNKDSGAQPSDFFVARIVPSSGRARLGYRHIGRVWGYGINDAGLCVAGTAAHPVANRPPVIPSIGLYLVGPILLSECASVSEAVTLMKTLDPVAEPGNVLVADEKDAAVVEFAPDERVVRTPKNGIIASTNYYASGKIESSKDEVYLAETRARYSNILRLAAAGDDAAVGTMKLILTNHSDAGSVCRHGSDGDRTAFSFIAEPRTRRFLVSDGHPCEHGYDSYSMEQPA